MVIGLPRRMRWGRSHPELSGIISFLRALAGGPRWAIIKVIGDKELATSEIYDLLVNRFGFLMPRSLLYYHLDGLEKMGIIEMVRYQETGKGGAPEKVWRLKIKRVVIDLPSGSIHFE